MLISSSILIILKLVSYTVPLSSSERNLKAALSKSLFSSARLAITKLEKQVGGASTVTTTSSIPL